MEKENVKSSVKLEDVLNEIKEKEAETEGASDPAVSGEFVIPEEAALKEMTKEERREAYEKILSIIDSEVESKVSHLSDKYKKSITTLEDTTVKDAFSKSEKFSGFGENIASIDRIIEKIPVLATLPANEKYTVAYLINEGLRSRENSREISAQSLVEMLKSRPDALRLFEIDRAQEIANGYDKTPAFAASKGTASMPANIKSSPRTIDEASRYAYTSFGLKF